MNEIKKEARQVNHKFFKCHSIVKQDREITSISKSNKFEKGEYNRDGQLQHAQEVHETR